MGRLQQFCAIHGLSPGATRFFSLASFLVFGGACLFCSAMASLISQMSSLGVPLPLPIAIDKPSTGLGTQDSFLFEQDAERRLHSFDPWQSLFAGDKNAAPTTNIHCSANNQTMRFILLEIQHVLYRLRKKGSKRQLAAYPGTLRGGPQYMSGLWTSPPWLWGFYKWGIVKPGSATQNWKT
jgi:hypothetical protein